MATMRDALGFEELADVSDTGSKVSQLWITGSITSQSVIQSATNFSGVGSVFAGRVQSTALITSDTNVSGVGSIFGGLVLEGGLYRPQRFADGAGSPTSYVQRLVFTGSGATGAGSTATIVFTTAFGTAPNILITPGSGSLGTSFGVVSFSTGSFTCESSTASKNFNWSAVGAA